MRCPDCNGFRSYDTEADPEGDLEIDAEGTITGDITRDLPCSDCGTVLKSAEFNVDQDLNEIVDVQELKSDPNGLTLCTKAHDWDWANASQPAVSPTERLEDKDKNGKQIKAMRFMTKYYGIEVTGEVRCKDCPAAGIYSFSDEQSASSFDEQV